MEGKLLLQLWYLAIKILSVVILSVFPIFFTVIVNMAKKKKMNEIILNFINVYFLIETIRFLF